MHYSHGEDLFLHERCSVDLSRDYTFRDFWLPSGSCQRLQREIAASDSIYVLYTKGIVWAVINRPKSGIWVSCRHFSKNLTSASPSSYLIEAIPGGPKNGTVNFLGLCSDQQLSFFTLLDRTSFPHYNNTKIIKFGWKLFILWVISYGLLFSGFAINFSLVGGPPKNGTVTFLGLCSDEQLFFHLAG